MQGRGRTIIEKCEADNWAVYIHDEGHAVHDKKAGHVRGPRGERSVLPRSGSGLWVTYHCSVSTKGEVVAGEYARGDARTFVDHASRLLKKNDKVVMFTDNHSSHFFKDAKRPLRELRRKNPGKKIRARPLPVGSPYLSIIEEIWNMLKAILLARFYSKSGK